MKRLKTLAAVAVLAGFASPARLLACAACFGKSDSKYGAKPQRRHLQFDGGDS